MIPKVERQVKCPRPMKEQTISVPVSLTAEQNIPCWPDSAAADSGSMLQFVTM